MCSFIGSEIRWFCCGTVPEYAGLKVDVLMLYFLHNEGNDFFLNVKFSSHEAKASQKKYCHRVTN